MAAMDGLGVLLETTAAATQQKLLPPRPAIAARTPAAETVSKATLLTTTKNDVKEGPHAPMWAPAASSTCWFLQRCYLCHRELAEGRDIFMYRGDRAFCSEECRCRHILVEDDDCARVVVADCSRR